ncbi:hypothetical protein GCM10009546_46920 [Actinomadura livida]|uniref:Asp23/Gls24 family envelope stress response protein n=1 Tax=Actinomadura livida TaxID=79909 RepID=A0ABP3Q4U3_9ACTN|nr:hypothetical protein GCM10010208_25110 [Actinomadura livida]
MIAWTNEAGSSVRPGPANRRPPRPGPDEPASRRPSAAGTPAAQAAEPRHQRPPAVPPRSGEGPAGAAGAVVELASRIGAAATGCPDVLGLTSGPRGWIATYRPGPPLAGVAVRPGEIEVGVVVRYGRPCAEIADDVRRLVRPLAGGRRVTVLIGDIADERPVP